MVEAATAAAGSVSTAQQALRELIGMLRAADEYHQKLQVRAAWQSALVVLVNFHA